MPKPTRKAFNLSLLCLKECSSGNRTNMRLASQWTPSQKRPRQRGHTASHSLKPYSAELAAIKYDFRLGDGIYFDSGNHSGVGVQLVET